MAYYGFASSVAMGTTSTVSNNNSIAIGYATEAEPKNCIIIGTGVKAKGPNEVRIGTPGQTVYLAGENVSELFERVEKLEELVQAQSELINSLWYHPGNPGALEAEARYRRHANGTIDPEDDKSDEE